MTAYNKTIGIMALSTLKGIGPSFIKKVVTSQSFLSNNLCREILEIVKNGNKHIEAELIASAIENAHDTLLKCNLANIHVVDVTNPEYPSLLKEIKDPPPIIYCKGNLNLLNANILCIIGTRKPNENGIKISERIGLHYANSGWTICNGLADGVDSFVIDSGGSNKPSVVGVLAGGLNYDAQKTLLTKTAKNATIVIENNGLLISEMPPDKKEDTFSVVKSCRIQAGISKGLILIQSGLEGGSRYTIKSFCETQRPLAVINPFKLDYNLESYSANAEIVKQGLEGLSNYTGLKQNKILTSGIFVIKSKDDYETFGKMMCT